MDNKLYNFIVHDIFIKMNHSNVQALRSYLEGITGVSPHLQPLEVANLPLFLRNRFSFYSMELFGRRWTLAIENASWETGSPGEYEKQSEILGVHLKEPLVFIISTLPSNTRNRMVQKCIPFIVPGNQAFLPSSLVDLREHFPKPRGKGRNLLSPTAQLALLYHLECQPLSGLPLCDIAQKLGCSAMMMSNVKDELEETGICGVVRTGRSIALKFSAEKRALWELAQSKLKSPVTKTRWVHWKEPGYPALLAGISALSRSTMLADERLPIYALGPKMLESWLENGTLIGCPDAEQATAQIEVWSYEPKILGDNERVDTLSLYLSLRDSPDERIQQQLETLIREFPW